MVINTFSGKHFDYECNLKVLNSIADQANKLLMESYKLLEKELVKRFNDELQDQQFTCAAKPDSANVYSLCYKFDEIKGKNSSQAVLKQIYETDFTTALERASKAYNLIAKDYLTELSQLLVRYQSFVGLQVPKLLQKSESLLSDIYVFLNMPDLISGFIKESLLD